MKQNILGGLNANGLHLTFALRLKRAHLKVTEHRFDGEPGIWILGVSPPLIFCVVGSIQIRGEFRMLIILRVETPGVRPAEDT